MRCESFDGFASVERIPRKLLEPGAATHLIGYIRSTPTRAKKRAMDVARQQAKMSLAMNEYRNEAAIKRRALIENNSAALARSDHLPIVVHLRATLTSPAEQPDTTRLDAQVNQQHGYSSPAAPAAGMASSFATATATLSTTHSQLQVSTTNFCVVSHNVQELVEDGISMYASCLASSHLMGVAPAYGTLKSARELVGTLVGAMLSPAVRNAQREVLVTFLETHVPKCDAVCLQELSNELVGSLEAVCAAHAPRWYFHASMRPASQRRFGGCDARTAILSVRKFMAEDDCVVTFQSSSATPTARIRRYATVTFLPDKALASAVTLISTHVLHSSCKSNASGVTHGNIENIRTSEEQVLAQLRPRLATADVVMLVGDFNGPLGDAATSIVGASSEVRNEVGVRIWQKSPAEATQLTRQGAAAPASDGVVVMSTTALTVTMLDCCLSL
jgi:endonuclease/exonuclease/phosphatase family metal-dependent hydrolase